MKKYLSFAVSAMAILGLGSLTSCHDEDFDVSTTVLQERAFEQNFIKEFGKPSADQSWDFYAQMMESLRDKAGATRATMAIEFDPEDEKYLKDADQPEGTDFQTMLQNQIDKALKEGNDNSNVGQNTYSLVSTGTFRIYAVRYIGDIPQNFESFEFGMAYMDGTQEKKVPLFGPKNTGTNIYGVDKNGNTIKIGVNPLLGKTVNFDKGESFYFYIKYTDTGKERLFYSNQTPTTQYYTSWFGNVTWHNTTYSKFGGTSTLLYSSEINGKQYMIIGIEDAWGYANNRNTDAATGHPDYDFNDVVIVLEGELPVPTSKRFFCEDLQSYDWDYNDVVFDVTSRGVVLRAVGGTLPVYLEITDKKNNSWTSGELHELMWEKQTQEEKDKHPEVKIKGTEYYKPIRVGANPGLKIEAVAIGPVWDYANMVGGGNALALTDDEVIAFANPKATKPVGGIKLIVGTVTGKETIVTDDQTVVKNGSFTVIDPTVGTAPAIWAAPSSVAWMKERVKITDGYKNFYEGGGSADQYGGISMWWSDVALGNTYQFPGDDVDPDRVGD